MATSLQKGSFAAPRRSVAIASLLCLASLFPACGVNSSPLADGETTTPDEQLFQDAVALLEVRDYAGAKGLLDQLWEEYPDSRRHDNAGYLRGKARYFLDDHTEALNALAEFRGTHPDSIFVSSADYFIGRCHFQLDDFQTARSEFLNSLAADAAGTYADNAQYYVGRCYYETEEFARARTELHRVEQEYPESPYIDNARYYIGRSSYSEGNFAAAVDEFSLVFEFADSGYTDDAEFYSGRSQYALNQLMESETILLTLVETQADSQYLDNAYYYLVRVYVDGGDCAKATATFSQLSPLGGQYVNLASTYLSDGGC